MYRIIILSGQVREPCKFEELHTKHSLKETINPNSCVSVGKIMIINAPFWFTSFWNVFKNFISEKTRNKTIIMGSNYYSTLLENVDENVIPPIWGGKGKSSFDYILMILLKYQ